MELSDAQLLRYSRQIMLPGFDLAGQQALLESRVLVVGLGGLGCPAAMYLASSGVGQLVLADSDRVELSNLQRQIAHTHAAIGEAKVESAARTLRALNPDIELITLAMHLEGRLLVDWVQAVDLVVDASDNFATRFALNAACVQYRVPLVCAAAIRSEAQITVFDARSAQSPCYRCLYHDPAELDASCSENGVMAPVTGIIGAAQAMEAIKLLSAYGESLLGRLLLFDAKTMEWNEVVLQRNPDCPVCGR
jgi:adenylyltransferase/sulfurtransferase